MPYLYQDHYFCDDCGEALVTFCRHHEIDDDKNQTNYPQYISDLEPQEIVLHCASEFECQNTIQLEYGHKIGAFLDHELSDTGIIFVRMDYIEAQELNPSSVERQTAEYWIGKLFPEIIPDDFFIEGE